MKQLDVVVSPPAFLWDPYFTLIVIFGPMNYFLVTDGQTDRWKVTHKSPPCISTSGLKKGWLLLVLDQFRGLHNFFILNISNGRARLSWPGSIWSAPTPVLSNRKYLTIVYKRIDLECSGHDNRAWPMQNAEQLHISEQTLTPPPFPTLF